MYEQYANYAFKTLIAIPYSILNLGNSTEMEKKSQRHRLFAQARKKHLNPNRDTDENQGADR